MISLYEKAYTVRSCCEELGFALTWKFEVSRSVTVVVYARIKDRIGNGLTLRISCCLWVKGKCFSKNVVMEQGENFLHVISHVVEFGKKKL